MPQLGIRQLLQRAAQAANAPLLRKEELRRAFKDPPKKLRQLPRYYVDHLRDVFSSPKKFRLAMTDLTPLGLAQTALTVPAALHLMKSSPDRKGETLAGMVGNILGGQVMQRTGIMGGVLGGLVGEVAGRAIARPFSSRSSPPPLNQAIGNRLQKVRNTGQRIDDVLGIAQEKLGATRERSEVVIYSDAGVLAKIKSPTWLKLPGGGIEKDETPEEAARREVIEESAHLVGELTHIATLTYSIPEDMRGPRGNDKSTNHLYIAEDGGRVPKLKHPDLERYQTVKFDRAIEVLQDAINSESAKAFKEVNKQRLTAVRRARTLSKLVKAAESMFGAGGADGMTQHNPTVTDSEFGGTSPRLQTVPGELGRRESISERGKTIGTGDTLFGDIIRLVGGGTVESRRKGDPFGLHVDLNAIFDGPTIGAIPGADKALKDRS